MWIVVAYELTDMRPPCRHRVNTILESDRVLVLDAGKVIEFDTPQTLLTNKQSSFYSLAAEAGLA